LMNNWLSRFSLELEEGGMYDNLLEEGLNEDIKSYRVSVTEDDNYGNPIIYDRTVYERVDVKDGVEYRQWDFYINGNSGSKVIMKSSLEYPVWTLNDIEFYPMRETIETGHKYSFQIEGKHIQIWIEQIGSLRTFALRVNGRPLREQFRDF